MDRQTDIFERAKRQLSVPDALRNEGARVRGDNFARNWRAGGRKGRLKVCPLCGSKGETFSFCQTGWRCHSAKCNVSGSVVDLMARIYHCSPLEAAKRITGEDEGAKAWKRDYLAGKLKPEKIEQPQQGDEAPPAFNPARIIYKGAMPAALNDSVVTYLTARGVAHQVAVEAARVLGFNPGAPYRFDESGNVLERHPAMVAIVKANAFLGPLSTGGIHCTYLAADFRSKVAVKAAKKMWGPQGIVEHDVTVPGGVMLVPPRSGGWLCIAEGIETTLSLCSALRMSMGVHAGAFATLSLNRLQGGMAQNKWGKADYFRPSIDIARPPALWPHKGPVLIGVDNDMSDLREKDTVDKQTGEVTEGRLIASGARRAQVCGLLASQWWKRAGASAVRVASPPRGSDWNDIVRGMDPANQKNGGMDPAHSEKGGVAA